MFTTRPSLTIFFFVVCIFLISALKPWYTHRLIDGQYWVLDYPPSVPFMWQYDKDANAQLGSTAFFPDYYKLQPLLTDRPTMHALGWAIGQSIYPVIQWASGLRVTTKITQKGLRLIENSDLKTLYPDQFNDPEFQLALLNRYISGAAGLVIFKLAFFFLSGLALFRLASHFSSNGVALFSVIYLLTDGYLINAIGTYHTYEFQIFSPIIICFLFFSLCQNYSLTRNIAFSLIVGLLMMAKPNYAAYIAILVYALLFFKDRRFVVIAAFISVISHSLPWALWHIFLELKGFGLFGLFSTTEIPSGAPPLHPFSLILSDLLTSDSHRAQVGMEPGLPAGNGATLLQASGHNWSLLGLTVGLKIVTSKVLATIHAYGMLPGFLAAASFFTVRSGDKTRSIFSFFSLLIIAAVIQATVAFPFLWHDRFVFDSLFLIYFLASISIFKIIGNRPTKNIVLISFLAAVLFFTIVNKTKLPWIHPFDQKGEYSERES
jgi:hypothetical protein